MEAEEAEKNRKAEVQDFQRHSRKIFGLSAFEEESLMEGSYQPAEG